MPFEEVVVEGFGVVVGGGVGGELGGFFDCEARGVSWGESGRW